MPLSIRAKTCARLQCTSQPSAVPVELIGNPAAPTQAQVDAFLDALADIIKRKSEEVHRDRRNIHAG